MPEVSKDASILIGISWQALRRAEKGDERTKISDCTVALVFAGFYIEANLNQIIDILGKKQEMVDFLQDKRPGLQDKLAWFYNYYIAETKLKSKKEGGKDLYDKLRVEFSGFNEIYKFRNDISHGNIDSSIANLADVQKLRSEAKSIVEKLFKFAEKSAGYAIPRTTTYYDAISE